MAVFVERQLGRADVVAAVGVAQERFAAIAGPFDGALDVFAGKYQRGFFAVQINLAAKTAAHIGRHHTHLVLRDAQHKGTHQQAFNVWVLTRYIERVAVVVAVIGSIGGTRLHGVGNEPVVAKFECGDMRRAGDGRVGCGFVANAPNVAAVVGRFNVHAGACVEGQGRVDHGGQLFVVHLDELRGHTRLFQRISHHQGHAVTHAAHFAVGQHGVLGLFHRRAVQAVDEPAAGQPAHGLEVFTGEDAQHARRFFSRCNIQRLDVRVGIRRAQKKRVTLLRQGDVVGVLALAPEEARIFAALNTLAGKTLSGVHGDVPSSLFHGGRAQLHGLDDVVITRAAADVAVQAFTHLGFAVAAVLLHQVNGTHHHAWRAKTALQTMAGLEGGLHGVQRAVFGGNAFDRGDFTARNLCHQHVAAFHSAAVQVHGAGAALRRVAAHMGARQLGVFADEFNQQRLWWHVAADVAAVDAQGDDGHGVS